MGNITKEMKGEIALKILKFKVFKEGSAKLQEGSLRELANTAKKLEISPEDLKQFFKEIYQELLDEMFK